MKELRKSKGLLRVWQKCSITFQKIWVLSMTSFFNTSNQSLCSFSKELLIMISVLFSLFLKLWGIFLFTSLKTIQNQNQIWNQLSSTFLWKLSKQKVICWISVFKFLLSSCSSSNKQTSSTSKYTNLSWCRKIGEKITNLSWAHTYSFSLLLSQSTEQNWLTTKKKWKWFSRKSLRLIMLDYSIVSWKQ